MSDLETIEATYRAVTPMFLGGADNEQAEFRLPSFKGMLRFWWRALAWGRYGGELEEIHRKEAELFGSAEQDIGQAQFMMKVDGDFPDPIPANRDLTYSRGNRKRETVGDGVCYLGYGVLDYRGSLERQCLPPGFEFTVRILPKPGIDEDLRDSLVDALRAVGLFGGLGSRVRRGFGSLSLVECRGKSTTQSIDSLIRAFQSATSEVGSKSPTDGLSEFTALNDYSKFVGILGEEKQSPLKLANRFGERMKAIREEYSEHDADIMRGIAQSDQKPDEPPARMVFGLPHNYFFKNSGATPGVTPADADYERRASPLWIKFHQLDDGRPVAFLQYLPAEFLEDDTVQIGRHKVEFQSDGSFWSPIGAYVTDCQTDGECIHRETHTCHFELFE
jgi:CRISPR-associated protein Cmr1